MLKRTGYERQRLRSDMKFSLSYLTTSYGSETSFIGTPRLKALGLPLLKHLVNSSSSLCRHLYLQSVHEHICARFNTELRCIGVQK